MSSEPASQSRSQQRPQQRPQPEDSRVLTDPTAMRALAHPVRMALLELFGVHETLTATQASEILGESPANCAFHLRTLAKYGYLREAGGGRGRERPWEAVGRNFTVTSHQDDPQAAVAADELSRMVFDRWVDRARRVLGAAAEPPGWEHAAGWSMITVFLTASETREMGEEMRRMLDRYDARRADPALRPPGALPVEWALFAVPVTNAGVPPATEPTPGSGQEPSQETRDIS